MDVLSVLRVVVVKILSIFVYRSHVVVLVVVVFVVIIFSPYLIYYESYNTIE